MLIHNASQLIALTPQSQRGKDLGTLNLIEQGAMLIHGESIVAVGTSEELLHKYPNERRLDVHGKVVMPGLIDPHTHLVWAGDRAAEFEMRLQGKTYMQIMAAGGGIQSTVNATRAAKKVDLLAQTRERANTMFAYGTTTAEAKTGYGLQLSTELAQMETLLELDEQGPLEILPTFLAAHAIPAEFKDDSEGYTQLVVGQMLPSLKDWWRDHASGRPLPFVDVFCENGAFNLAQTHRILESAKSLGFPLKVHTDEFENIGGTQLAIEMGAVSADHLVKTSADDILAFSDSSTVAVALPCTPFGLAEGHYTPAKAIVDSGGVLAIASDLNPGTAWCESMQFVMALACRYLHLTPAQALAAATINAAAAIRCEDRLGSLHPGKQADILILSVSDYRHLAYRFGDNLVDTVFKKGNRILPTGPK
jgi:imidazolonepropionase